MARAGDSRRRFLKIATAAIGGAVAAVLGVPLVRYLFYPVGRDIVSTGDEPIDVAAASAIEPGGPPVRVELRVSRVRDAWSAVRDVALGAAYLVRSDAGEVKAFSSTCPHLGCAIAYSDDTGKFHCPCHDSAFAARSGEKLMGPAKRGLDPLPVEVKGDRVLVTFKRYRADVSGREEV